MRRLESAARWAWLLVALAILGAVSESPGHAQDTASVAGLVVLDESGAIGYALVAFEEAEISGMDLLRRSGAEPVAISFGGLGEGVCGIGQTGCAVDVCRKRMCQTGSPESPFWQSFQPTPGSGWSSLQLGASADRVRDGDVRLWAWTGTVPLLQPLDRDDISTKVGDARNQLIWEGGSERDPGTETSPFWLGVALLGAGGAIAAVVRLRGRSRPP